jgi:hypothetical protein
MLFPLDVLYHTVQFIPDDRDSCAIIESSKFLNRVGKRNGYRKSIHQCLCEIETFNTSQITDIVVESCISCIQKPKRSMHADRFPKCVSLTIDKSVVVEGVWENTKYVVNDICDMDSEEYTQHEEDFIDNVNQFFPNMLCLTSLDN